MLGLILGIIIGGCTGFVTAAVLFVDPYDD